MEVSFNDNIEGQTVIKKTFQRTLIIPERLH